MCSLWKTHILKILFIEYKAEAVPLVNASQGNTIQGHGITLSTWTPKETLIMPNHIDNILSHESTFVNNILPTLLDIVGNTDICEICNSVCISSTYESALRTLTKELLTRTILTNTDSDSPNVMCSVPKLSFKNWQIESGALLHYKSWQ